MNWQIRSGFTIAIFIIFAILGMVFLNVNSIAKRERTQIQAEMIQVQQNIAVHLSGDYESGLKLIDQLMIEDDEKIQKIKYDLLDDLMTGLSEEKAFEKAGAFFNDENATLNIYSVKDKRLLKSFGLKVFNVSSQNLNISNGDNPAGFYKMFEKPIQEDFSEEVEYRLYYYVSKSQPWIMVTNIRDKKQPELSQATKKVVSSNMNQVNKNVNFHVMETNSRRKIIDASSAELLGGKIADIKPYDRAKDMSGLVPLFTFGINLADGTQDKWVGTITETETSSIVIATKKSAYDKEYQQLTFIMLFIMLVSFLFAIAIVLLIHRNYLYFLENEQMGGESL